LILGAVYVLRVLQFTHFGPAGSKTQTFERLQTNETITLGVLSLLIIVLGVYPQPLLDLTAAAVAQLTPGQ
jgi:NADH-quinone oxidoreductase subunit M